MAKILIPGGGSGGIDPDELTATAGDVLAGKTAGVNGLDDPVTGTLSLTGNAISAHVLSGYTFYNTNPKTRQTGTMPEKAGTAWQSPRSIVYNGAELSLFTNNGHYADSNYLYANNAQLASSLGIEAWKVRKGVTIAGVAGACLQWCSYDVTSGANADGGFTLTNGASTGHGAFVVNNIGFTPIAATWFATNDWHINGCAHVGLAAHSYNGQGLSETYFVNSNNSGVNLTQAQCRLPLPDYSRTYIWHIYGYYI